MRNPPLLQLLPIGTRIRMPHSHPNAVANFFVEDAPWTTIHTNAPPIPYAAATVTATISRVANPAQNNKGDNTVHKIILLIMSQSIHIRKNFSTFSCLQINTRHCKAASASLSQLALDNNYDIICVQEPYAFLPPISLLSISNPSPRVSNIPPGYRCFHN